jgi:hypothetical protein
VTTGPYQVMPPLSDEELVALRESIIEHGVMVPVVIDEKGEVIDGHHRRLVADTLGVEFPVDLREGLTEAEKRTLAFELNTPRRHLDTNVKRALVTRSLKLDPEVSDRVHAIRVGVAHKTVGRVRRSLERRGEIPKVEQRESADGRKRPAGQPPKSTGDLSPVDDEDPSSNAPASPPGPVEQDDDAAHDAEGVVGSPAGGAGAAPEGVEAGGSGLDPSENDEPAPSFATVGDLIDWCPDHGKWRTYDEMTRTDSARQFGRLMDTRLPRDEDDDLAGCCPPEARRAAIFAAEVAATYWTDLAADLRRLDQADRPALSVVEG